MAAVIDVDDEEAVVAVRRPSDGLPVPWRDASDHDGPASTAIVVGDRRDSNPTGQAPPAASPVDLMRELQMRLVGCVVGG